MHGTAIDGRAVGCRLGRRTILTDVDLEVRPGDRMHVTGGNGAGKSTLLRCLAGTMAVTAGTLEICGRPPTARASRAVVGACLHPEQGLYTRLSGRQNLLFAARLVLPAGQITTAVAEVEAELGITAFADQPVRGYSAGMRARVGIARALLGSPVVLLFDEPTRSLDEAGRELFWAAVRARPDTACVFASHLAEDRAHATSVTALADGRPVARSPSHPPETVR